MAEATTVKHLKQLCSLAHDADDPTTLKGHDLWRVVLSVLSAGRKGKPTLNHAFLSAILAAVIAPEDLFTIGEGWAGEHHGGPVLGFLNPPILGATLGELALVSEVNHGLQGGGKEFHGGYAPGAYYPGYLLGLRHGSPEMRDLGARALGANLAIDYLLTVPGTGQVIEIGGRATGGPNTYAAIIQALWRGDKDVRVPQSDAGISCQMFEALTAEERAMLPDFPQGVEDAVEILEGAGVVCPAEFEWWHDVGDHPHAKWWRAQVNQERSWFIDKRTGERALLVTMSEVVGVQAHPDHGRSSPVDNYDWHLSLGADGLAVHRRPGGEAQPPTPAPSPPPPEEETARLPNIAPWRVEHWLRKGGAPEWAFDRKKGIPEILWQAQQMERGVVEAEGRLVVLVKEMNRWRRGQKDA